MERIEVREASEEDAEEILRVHSTSIRRLGPEAYDEHQVDAWDREDREPDDYIESIRDDEKRVVVAISEGTVVGFGDVNLEEGEITAVYVDPDHVREGVGTALLERLEAIARENGLGSLELLSTLVAVDFYEDAGYEPVEEVEYELTGGDGVEVTCVEMEKDL